MGSVTPLAVPWRASTCDRESIAPGRAYGWCNRDREPLGTAVVQATLGGQVVLTDATGTHVSTPGTLMLFVYGESTSYGRVDLYGPTYTCQWVNLEGAGLVEHFDVLRARHGPVLRLPNMDSILAEMDEVTTLVSPSSSRFSDDPVVVAAAVHTLIMRLFDLSQRSLRQATRPVDWAVEQTMRQATRPWSLKEYADHYGVSREHLSRVFREKTGESAHDWLTGERLRVAVRLLRDTDLSIQQVAKQSGFTDTRHLARCMRVALGRSPSDERAKRGDATRE